MSAEIMALFGTLSSPHIDERISAATLIVYHLTRVEKDSGEGLAHDGCLESADFNYTLKRLVRGLASPTPGARLGFSVVLCEVLSRFPQLSPETVFDLILSSTPLQGSLKASEERDALFGRLFGIKCIVQSGSLFRQSQTAEENADEATKLRLNVLNRLVDELGTLVRRGAYLAESVGSVLVSGLAMNILRQPESLPWKSQALNYLVHKFLVEDKTWSKEKLSMAILMQQHSVEVDWNPIVSGTFPDNVILSTGNHQKLCSMLTSDNAPTSQKHQPKPLETDGKAASGATELPIRPHFIHSIIITGSQLAPKFGLSTFYNKLFESYYFTAESSVAHRSHGFLILTDLLKSDHVSEELKPTFLTPNCIHILKGQLAGKDRLLHKMAQSVVSTIIGEAKRGKSSIARGFATQIRAAEPHFDHDSRSKLMEGLLSQMSAPDLELWAQELITAFQRGSPCWPNHQAELSVSGDELDPQRHVEQFRERILAPLCVIIRTKPASCTKTCVHSILRCLLLCAFFGESSHDTLSEPASDVPKQKKTITASTSNESSSSPSFSAGLRDLCKARFYTCLLDLLNHNTMRDDAKKSKTKASALPDKSTGYRGSEIALEILASHLDNTLPNGRRPSSKTDGEDLKQVKGIRKIVSRLHARATASKNLGTKQDRLVLLCETVLLMSHDDQEGMAEALPLFERLENDFDTLLPLNGKCKTSNASQSLAPAMANMMEILLFLHSWPIAFLRAVVDRIFDAFLDSMGSESLQILVNQINPPEDPEDDDQSDCSDSAADSEESDQNSSEDSDQNSSSDCGHSNTEDEPDSADESADEAFRNEVAMALGHAMAKASESDESSAEESVAMDDDEMLALDSNLGALFQRRNGKQSAKIQNTQDLHLRLKLLELIGKSVKFQSNPSTLARSIGPLMDLVKRVDSDEIVMKTKVVKILQAVSRLPRKPSSVNDHSASEPLSAQEVSDIVTSVHRIARTTQVPDLPELCLKCNLWLIDVIQSAPSDFVVEDQLNQARGDLLKIHKDSLEHFCIKRSSKLRPLFFTQTIRRHPAFGWMLRDDILRLITSPATRNAYRRNQMLGSLAKLLNSYPSRAQWAADSCKGLEEFLHSVQKTIVVTLPASTAMPDAENAPTKARQPELSHIKELLKICVDAVRRTLKITTEAEKFKKAWPAQETRMLAECVQQIPHSPHSELIARLVQQLVALLDITLPAEPTNDRAEKKRKKASLDDATVVVDADKKSVAGQATSEEAAGKEKKSKKRHKSSRVENV